MDVSRIDYEELPRVVEQFARATENSPAEYDAVLLARPSADYVAVMLVRTRGERIFSLWDVVPAVAGQEMKQVAARTIGNLVVEVDEADATSWRTTDELRTGFVDQVIQMCNWSPRKQSRED